MAEVPSPNPHGAMGAKACKERLYQTAEEYLNDVARRFFPDEATSKIVSSESPAKEILDYASQRR